MVGRIYHVGLTVSDLERSIAFYRDCLLYTSDAADESRHV